MLPWPSAFSSPPTRCSRPGVPGIAHGRASVSRVALVRPELPVAGLGHVVGLGGEVGVERRQRVEVGQLPRLGAVGEVAVGQQHHRRPVGQRDPGRLDGRVEAVAGRLRRDDRQRRLAVAAVHRLQQVGLLGLGRQAGRGTAALDVDDDQRQLERDREPDRLRLQRDARARTSWSRPAPRRTRHPSAAPMPGDLVLGLERHDAEPLVLAAARAGCRRPA